MGKSEYDSGYGVAIPYKNINKKDLKIAKYRLEFLRRKREYVKDYLEYKKKEQAFVKRLKKEEGAGPPYFHEEVEFCNKWKIGVPFNPEESFDNILKNKIEEHVKSYCALIRTVKFRSRIKPLNESNEGLSNKETAKIKDIAEKKVKEWLCANLIPEYLFDTPVDDSDNFDIAWTDDSDNDLVPSKEFLDRGILKIKIDLNYSKNAIEKIIKKILNYWQEKYDQNMKNKLNDLNFFKSQIKQKIKNGEKKYCTKRIKELERELNEIVEKRREIKERITQQSAIPISRKEFAFYDDYLKVWDLVQKIGRKWTQIAKEIFKEELEGSCASLDSARKKAANYYKEAGKIMDAMGNS